MLLQNAKEGKTIVITGGNSGIGLETARGLYADGHRIIIASRNAAKNEEAVKSVTSFHPHSKGSISSFELDLTKKQSVELFAEHVTRTFSRLDILLNNAGLILKERAISQLGVEMTYTVNHFGPFYLTFLLFPLLEKSTEARIINVSSTAHFQASSSLVDDPKCDESWGSMGSYYKSKLANVMFASALADRLKNHKNIKAASLHPGFVDSEFGSGVGGISCLRIFCCCLYVNNEDGARTSLFLSRVKFEQLQSGAYYHSDTSLKEMNPLGEDKKEMQRLWELGQKLYGIKFDIK